MYKVTFLQIKLKFLAANFYKDAPVLAEEYINNFTKDGWELISATTIYPVGFIFFWKKI